MVTHKRLPSLNKSAPLPADYTKMVSEVFNANFDKQLKAVSKIKKGAYFLVRGNIFADEIVLTISLAFTSDEVTALGFHASIDFDPKANAPKAEDLLAICVDVLGNVLSQTLDTNDKKRLKLVTDTDVSKLGLPRVWTEFRFEKRTVFILVDKANAKLDQQTEEWLQKNDPDYEKTVAKEQKEVEDMIVTPGKKKGDLH